MKSPFDPNRWNQRRREDAYLSKHSSPDLPARSGPLPIIVLTLSLWLLILFCAGVI